MEKFEYKGEEFYVQNDNGILKILGSDFIEMCESEAKEIFDEYIKIKGKPTIKTTSNINIGITTNRLVNTYAVFQGKQYYHESKEGYIWHLIIVIKAMTHIIGAD